MRSTHQGAPRGTHLGSDLGVAIPFVWLLCFFVAPLVVTVGVSFHAAEFGGVSDRLTVDNYRQLFTGLYLQTFVRTVLLAVVASLITVLIAIPISHFIAVHAGHARGLLLVLVIVPYFSSFLIRVLAWQTILSWGGLYGSMAAVLIGMIYAYLPIAILPMYLLFRRIPKEFFDAASDLGASPWAVLRTVTLPLAKPGIVTSLLLTAVPMLGELVVPQILGAGRGLFLGQLVQTQYLQNQNQALGSAVAVGIMIAVGVLVALLLRFTRSPHLDGGMA